MKFFQEVQKGFNSLGFCPKPKPFNYRQFSILVKAVLVVISLWIFLIHEANSAQEYLESIYVVTTSTCVFLSFTSIFIWKNLYIFIESFDELLNDSLENPTSKNICVQTNELVEKCSKIGILIMNYGLLPCFLFPKIIISFFIYFTTDAGNDSFDLPFPVWLPYDWKNPIGYLLTVIIQFNICFYVFRYVGCIASFVLGVFVFAMALVKILKNELRTINKMAHHKKSRNRMYKNLSKFIKSHANVKQLAISFSDFFEITLTSVFVGCTITLCVEILMVQIEISYNETESIVLLEAAVFGTTGIFTLLFVCELGQRFSNSIEEISDTIMQLEWYLYPVEIQRVLPTVMQSAQKPVTIKCFGNVLCARKQFRKVVKAVYSYFMMLRELYK